MSKAFRAKAKAEREIRGDHVLQYSMLKDYVVELQSTNPNTTVKIVVERNTNPSLPTRVFQRIYVCLGALKLGFKACRRDLLGLDGAFMKGPFPGQCLGDDIDLHPNSNFTFISDRKKGIIPAIKTVYPNAEHGYCLRHIHENIKQGWCGQAYKDLLWRAASATNVRDFEKCMLELKMMNPKAHEWLNKIPAEH
ncbi:mutator type transposase [Tanacetum coccineum]